MTQDCPAGIIQSEMAYGVALGGPLPDGGYALAADLDVKNGKEGPKSWIGLGQDYPYADTLAVRTASGGTHFYYSAPGVFSQKIGLRDGIDIKGFHTYTVGPGSIIKGRCYTIVHDVPPRPLPPELAALLTVSRAPKDKAAATAPPPGYADYEDDETARDRALGVLRGYRLDRGRAYEVACEVRDCAISEELCLQMVDEHWNARLNVPVSDESLEAICRNVYLHAQNPPGSKHPKRAFPHVDIEPPPTSPPDDEGTKAPRGDVPPPPDIPPPPDVPPPPDTPPPDYMRSDKGKLLNNLANAMTMLKAEFAGLLAYDQFALVPVLLRPIDAESSEGYPRQLEDHDLTELQRLLQRRGLAMLNSTVALQAVLRVAWECRFHPVRAWLNTLQWDGVERARWLFSDYLAADSGPYVERVSTMFLVGLVARVLRPGVKHDHMPVLEGMTGLGKSDFCRKLVGDEWFGDNLPPISSKDSAQYLRGKWLVELAELAVADKVESSHLKAFLSRATEDYRAPYGKLFAKEPRQCAFIATVNKVAYLRDETGDRRYWPVETVHFLTDLLVRDRAQLFAEALDVFRRGVTWWPDREFQKKYATPMQADKYEGDVWEESIATYIAKVEKATISQIAYHALDMTLKQCGKREQRRITDVLEHLGWHRHPRTANARFWGPRK
jgi:hypothetical protein